MLVKARYSQDPLVLGTEKRSLLLGSESRDYQETLSCVEKAGVELERRLFSNGKKGFLTAGWLKTGNLAFIN